MGDIGVECVAYRPLDFSSEARPIVKTFLAAALFFIASGPSASDADPLATGLQDLTSWQTFDWNSAATSPLWTDSHWTALPPTEGEDATHARTLAVAGKTWKARLRKRADDGALLLTALFEVPAGECAELSESFGRPLGQRIYSDQSHRIYLSDDAFMTIVMEQRQWTIGSTRLDVFCAGASNPSSQSDPTRTLTLVATFSSTASSPLLEPTFLIQCSAVISMLGADSDQRRLQDLVFSIDPTGNDVRTQRLTRLGDEGTVNVGPDLIKFTVTSSKNTQMKTAYTINRLTGAFSGDLTNGDRPWGTVSGSCQRISSERKF